MATTIGGLGLEAIDTHHEGCISLKNYLNNNRERLLSCSNCAVLATITSELNYKTAELEKANQTIIEREERFRLVLDGSSEGFWDWNIETGEIYRSERWLGILGYMSENVEPNLHSWAKIVHPDDIDMTMKRLNEYLDGRRQKYEAAYRLVTKSGETKWILERGSVVIRNENGEPLRMLGTCSDISEQKKAKALLRLSEDKFSKAFRSNPDPITITTLEEGIYVEMNDAWVKETGYERYEAIGRTAVALGIWYVPEERSLMSKQIKEQGVLRNFETKFQMKSGKIRIYSVSVETIDMDGKAHLICVHHDITDRKQAEAEIRYLSYHDKLTGLYNRTFFEEELKRINTEGQLPVGLIIGDVNGLKVINDALGHQEGDNVLIKAAELLRNSCRQEDIISRWGGDEFIILLPRSDSAATLRVFKQLNDSFIEINGLPIQINMSLGMAVHNSPDQDIRSVIREAEEKMYRNKLLETRSTRSSFIKSLEKTLWERSHETKEHCQRMREMAQTVGNALDLADFEMDNLKLLAALHDIGKIAIPNSILDKSEKLSSEEWETIKNHPEIGYRIAISSPELAPIAEAILYHHECWDGSGYPLGLKGESIPLISRIIAITDAYDVMINGRPYKKAMSKEETLAEIERCAGTQFDPNLVKKVLGFY